LAYYLLGVHDVAAEHYSRAAALAPRDPWSRYNLGLALEAAGRHADADAALQEAWALGQEDAEVCVSLARALTAHGRRPEEAVRAARRACGLARDSADPLDALAMALYSAGEHEAARGPAREATRLAPEVADYWYSLGVIEEMLGEVAAARRCFERAVELAPDFEEARDALHRLGDI